MKKIFYTLTFFVLVVSVLTGQQYTLFSNYMSNQAAFNPALFGQDPGVAMRFTHRSQWVGIDDRPVTSYANVHARLKNVPFGVGGFFYQDQAGLLGRNGGGVSLSSHLNLAEKTILSIGASGGYFRARLTEGANINDPSDPLVALGRAGQNFPDFMVGVNLRTHGFSVGVSAPQIVPRNLTFGRQSSQVQDNKLEPHLFGTLGYSWPLNSNVVIEPSVLVKFAQAAPLQYDAGARALLFNFLWLGGSWRSNDAASILGGVEYRGLSFQYNYDLTTSGLRTVQSGSHELTFGARFGGKKKDKDGDGIPDKEDKCPDVPGVKEHQGCPPPSDRDKDGIIDSEDKCPDEPGLKENFGCPVPDDRDRDGVLDKDDKCPDVPGLASLQGCPYNDRDGDGIRDDIDKCPDIAGTLSTEGCPQLVSDDADGDGIKDIIDKCPNTAGPLENGGCPEVSDDEDKIRVMAIRNVFFDTDKFEIRPEAYKYLNDLAKLLKNKKDWKVKMDGFADSRGTEYHNKILSKNRVESVKAYLQDKGVSSKQLITAFYGELNPIGDNKTEAGLQKNRRVQIEWFFD
jgi:type IX secretion system PorP/SprF family membrane protein